jgi:hypothetical protein
MRRVQEVFALGGGLVPAVMRDAVTGASTFMTDNTTGERDLPDVCADLGPMNSTTQLTKVADEGDRPDADVGVQHEDTSAVLTDGMSVSMSADGRSFLERQIARLDTPGATG